MTKLSKEEQQEILQDARTIEENRIITLLKSEDIFTPALQPLIDNYLDAFIIYKKMFDTWQEEGFPQTKLHENKAGAINEMKHPLAGQVETWLDKKNKMLESLGLTNKSKGVAKTKTEDKKEQTTQVDELALHRQKWRGSG